MITLSAQIEGFGSRADKSWKLTLGTNELAPSEIGLIGSMQNQVCFIAINPDPFTSEQKEIIITTKAELSETGKTPSQRLRGVLFINWQHDKKGYDQFHDYYLTEMEKIITHYKSKLD
tara:strand:+ start:3529 stop:3882 length:354 start_codon:yes stop_codon:yes gene_type:complete